MDWRNIVSAVAPVLGMALGGPLGGAAAKVVAGALLGKDDASEQELSRAVLGASPEQLAALKQAENDFIVRMRELDIDVERINADDRASARQREKDTGDSWTPRLLAFVVTSGFFGVLAWMLAYGIPREGGEALLVMLGSLGTAWAAIVSYYYGSSAGSAAKNTMLRKP